MTFYEFVSIVNFLLPTIAFVGYGYRILIGLKNENYNRFRIMLILYLLLSFGASMIYFLNFTGFWRILDPNYEVYSKTFIRPYFTFLGTVLAMSAWIHPELHPIIVKIKETLWMILRLGSIFKKK